MSWMDVAEFMDMDLDPSQLWLVPLAVYLWVTPLTILAFHVLAFRAKGIT